jgi:hypothetical protein
MGLFFRRLFQVDKNGSVYFSLFILGVVFNLKYWWPTDIEEEKWYLHHPVHNKFGIGTTYNDLIYHAFFSRENNSDGFINKCKSILGQ